MDSHTKSYKSPDPGVFPYKVFIYVVNRAVRPLTQTVKNIVFNQLDLNKKIEILLSNNDDSQFLAIFSKHVFTCVKKRRLYF